MTQKQDKFDLWCKYVLIAMIAGLLLTFYISYSLHLNN